MKQLKSKEKILKICKELNIELPEFAMTMFESKAFKSEAQLKEKLILIDAAINNKSNKLTVDSIKEFFNTTISNITLPLYGSTVSCGFTSPAEDHVENQLSLDEYLIPNPNATFFVRASGDSMTGAGIFDGDLLVIDRSITATSNNIILGVINTEFTVKRLIKESNKIILRAENPLFDDIVIENESQFMVWGVVVHVIHHLR